MIIAVTGVIGSGKSSVARQLSNILVADYCDTDEVCRRLLAKGNEGWQGVVQRWQSLFLDEAEEVDTVKLRQAIFNDELVRKELERILHPLVKLHVSALKEKSNVDGKDLVVEVPLLFEVGWQNEFDTVVTVFAPVNVCLQRIVERDGVSLEQARKSMEAQMDIEEKVKLSNFVVDNSLEPVNTQEAVIGLAASLKGENR